MSWVETDTIIFGMYLFFLLMVYHKATATPRPVSHWLRLMPVFILILGSGIFAGLMLFCPWKDLHSQSSVNPVPELGYGFGFAILLVFWGVLSYAITQKLFRPGGALCDQQVQHGRGPRQRLARRIFGPGDAARPATGIRDIPKLGASGKS